MANVGTATKFFPTAQEGFNTTTSTSTASGANTVTLNSVAGYANGEVVALVIDPANSKKQVFTGTIDTAGTQVTGVVWTEGANVIHTIGSTVVDYETATHWALHRKGSLVSHDEDGKLKSGAVYNSAALASDVVVNTKILNTTIASSKNDYSTYSLNMKAASNASSISPGNGTIDFSSNGVSVPFTVTSSCKAFVNVSMAIGSATDFEFQPQVYVDGTLVDSFNPAADLSNGNQNRQRVRGFSTVVTVPAGAHTISAGVFLASGSSMFINANAIKLAAFVQGNVTA